MKKKNIHYIVAQSLTSIIDSQDIIQHAAVVLLGINYLHSGYQTRKKQEAAKGAIRRIKVDSSYIFLGFCDIRCQMCLFKHPPLPLSYSATLTMEIGISEAVSTGYLGIL
jgi:hypothetical protein